MNELNGNILWGEGTAESEMPASTQINASDIASAFAPHEITFRCGHTGQVPHTVTLKDSAAYKVWASVNLDCLECYNESQAKAAEVQAEALGLPVLTGSYRQCRWAVTIRRERLEEIEAFRTIRPLRVRTEKALERRFTVANAEWWINTRDISFDLFVATKLPCRRKTRP